MVITERNTGGPAFPQAHDDSGSTGMTLRDYFAALALQGLLASTRLTCDRVITQDAYEIADAMLEARNG